jgi:hypothetical protein
MDQGARSGAGGTDKDLAAVLDASCGVEGADVFV